MATEKPTRPWIFCNKIPEHLRRFGERGMVKELTCAICGKTYWLCSKCFEDGSLTLECKGCGIRHCPDCQEHPDMDAFSRRN